MRSGKAIWRCEREGISRHTMTPARTPVRARRASDTLLSTSVPSLPTPAYAKLTNHIRLNHEHDILAPLSHLPRQKVAAQQSLLLPTERSEDDLTAEGKAVRADVSRDGEEKGGARPVVVCAWGIS